jgi:succinoglycan biosynthesis transport protein ExoP
MFQTLKTPTLIDRGAQTPAPGQGFDHLSLDELFKIFTSFLHRQYRVIVVAFLLMMALAAVYLFTTPPSFTAFAKLLIDSRKVQLFQQQSVLGETPADPGSVDSQVEILLSENVLLPVIKELHLTEDPEFVAPDDDLFSTIKGRVLNLPANHVIRDSIDSTSNTEKTSFHAKWRRAMTYNAVKTLIWPVDAEASIRPACR